MDQGPLVIEQIEGGVAFLREFDRHVPVKTAFWLKKDVDSYWYLYVASDQIDDSNLHSVYTTVGSVVNQMNDPNFDSFRVKVISGHDPIVCDVLDLQSRYSGRSPIRRRNIQFGGMSADEIYIYPLPITVIGH